MRLKKCSMMMQVEAIVRILYFQDSNTISYKSVPFLFWAIFGGIFDLFNRLHFIIAKQTSTMPKTRIPILEVDVVLVQDIEDDNQFSVIVTCPTCGSVNEHGLGPQCNRLRRLPKDNISNWGHRECNGHGYELVAASVIHFKLQG